MSTKSFYLVHGYRWGFQNLHNYVAFMTDEAKEAIEFAKNEVEFRGGKYGFQVCKYEGEERTVIEYFSSYWGEEKLRYCWQEYLAKRIGQEIVSLVENPTLAQGKEELVEAVKPTYEKHKGLANASKKGDEVP